MKYIKSFQIVASQGPSLSLSFCLSPPLLSLFFLLHLWFLLTTLLLLQEKSSLLLLYLLNTKLAGGILFVIIFAFSPFLHLVFLLYS